MENSQLKEKLEYNQNLVNVAKKCESHEKEFPHLREEKEWILRIIISNLTELENTIQDESLRETLKEIQKQTTELLQNLIIENHERLQRLEDQYSKKNYTFYR